MKFLALIGDEPMVEKSVWTVPGASELDPAHANRVYDRDNLSPEGNGDEVVTQGMWMALMNLVESLKARREAMGLTIAEVARRSRLTVVTISRLENLHNRNPSFDTVFRYAMALDALVSLGFEQIEPEEHEKTATADHVESSVVS